MAKINNDKKESSELNIIQILKNRFEENKIRHKDMKWNNILAKLNNNPNKLKVLENMENTGGEPDVVEYNSEKDEYIFIDFSKESPSGRRSLCYDSNALKSRKENKPKNNAEDMAKKIGIEILNEEQYLKYQKLGPFDTTTSSWIKTPESVRKLGGALFGDYRFGRIFFYHNTAQSYYSSRGFRGYLII